MQNFSSITNHDKNQNSHSSNYIQKKQSIFFNSFIQPRLTINQPNDIYEQEADAMADKVVHLNREEPAQTFFQACRFTGSKKNVRIAKKSKNCK